MPDLGTTVRERPLASTVVGGDCYSHGYSVGPLRVSLRAWLLAPDVSGNAVKPVGDGYGTYALGLCLDRRLPE